MRTIVALVVVMGLWMSSIARAETPPGRDGDYKIEVTEFAFRYITYRDAEGKEYKIGFRAPVVTLKVTNTGKEPLRWRSWNIGRGKKGAIKLAWAETELDKNEQLLMFDVPASVTPDGMIAPGASATEELAFHVFAPVPKTFRLFLPRQTDDAKTMTIDVDVKMLKIAEK